MDYFPKELVEKTLEQKFAFIKLRFEDNVLRLTLDRPEKKNALHPHMVAELALAMQFAKSNNQVWAVVIDAEGDVFCAGADLKAFMGMVGEFESSVPETNGQVLIAELFNKVHKPVITKVEGPVFAGGFFFLAGATYVVCNPEVRLGLPEVKRGLYPFQVMAALLAVMPKRKVIDWCIRGYDLDVEKAKEYGLVTHIASNDTMDETIDGLLNDLKTNSPSSIRLGLEALDHITEKESEQEYLMAMLQKTVATQDGQEGLMAFREKRKPNWTGN